MSGLMSIGKTAMYAAYTGLQTTGNNIANANTEGYSRQSVNLADAPGQYSGSGFFGKGVTVQTISRAYNQLLTSQAMSTGSVAAADSARSDKLSQLEDVFPIGATGIGYAAGELLNSFVDVSNSPADSSARQVVLSQAQELAARFRSAGDQLTSMQTGVTQDVKTQVASINSLATQVARLNVEISSVLGTGQQPNQLLDQRDNLVKQISSMINVSTIPADDGSLSLFIGGGQSLVLGNTTSTLKAVPDDFDPSKVTLAMVEGATTRKIPSDSLSGGSLAGLLKFQNQDLTAASNMLGQMAAAVAGAVNTQQSLGLDMGSPASAGGAIFSVGAPRVLSASTNSGSASLSVTVDDASKVQASDYSMSFDGTAYTLTRNVDGSNVGAGTFTPAQLAAGVQFDGITLQLTGGTPAVNDRFLIQPVSVAAQSMQSVLGSPKGIAAASPFTGSTGVNNTGTATLASLVAVDPSYDGTLSANFTFTSDTGNYNWSLSDGTSGTGTWTAGTPISLNGFELNLAGVPKNGDTIAVIPTTSVSANNGNALAFTRLAQTGIVGASGATAASTAPSTITDAYASALADIGVRVQGGKTAASMSSAASTQADAALKNETGVNLDEEAARLIQYQQSYQAAAKILQVAQAIFQSILDTAH